MSNENNETKEEFCPPCLAAVPLALAATGAGASQTIDGSTESGKNTKKMVLLVCVIIIGSIVGSILFYILCRWILIKIIGCKSCK